jgi:hypothetical protein
MIGQIHQIRLSTPLKIFHSQVSPPSWKLRFVSFKYIRWRPRKHDRWIGWTNSSNSSLNPWRSFTLKYQLPTTNLDSLISVTIDEDLENMIDEYYQTNSSNSSLNLPWRSFTPEHQLTNENLDSLVLKIVDEELENMTDEYDWTNSSNPSLNPCRSFILKYQLSQLKTWIHLFQRPSMKTEKNTIDEYDRTNSSLNPSPPLMNLSFSYLH